MTTTPELLKRLDAEIEIRAEVVRNHQFRARKEGKTTDRRLLQLLKDCRDALTAPIKEVPILTEKDLWELNR